MLEAIKTQSQSFLDWLLSPTPPDTLWAKRLAWRTLRILYALIRDLAQGVLTLRAMGLVYTTILSIVPLLALTFSLLKTFNFHDRFTPMLYQFFEPMGEKGLEIHDAVLQFVSNLKVGVLGVLGLIMLLYTVVSLIQKIEEAFNAIWHAPGPRSLPRRVSNYLTAVFLGPLLAVMAMSLTAATMNLDVVQGLRTIEPFGTLFLFVSKAAPFAIVIIGFFLFYLLMPNARVKASSAWVGAAVAGVSWQMMSIAFAHFIVGSAKYDAVYSGFAVGILLMIWVYLNWLVLLLGSSIAFYFQHGNYVHWDKREDASPELLEKIAVKAMAEVASASEKGGPAMNQADVEQMPGVPGLVIRKVLDRLLESGLLVVAGDKAEQLVPGRSTDKILLSEILRCIREDRQDLHQHLDLPEGLGEQLHSIRGEFYARLEQITLRDIIHTC